MIYHITPDQWERIPASYKEEHALTQPDRKACFICFLTKAYFCAGSTLCFEGLHFKITKPEERRTFTIIEENNGHYGVACLESEEARAFYDTGHIKVYEYRNPDKGDRLFRSILYAYQWRNEYADDLTQHEIADRLEELAKYEELEAGGYIPKYKPGTYISIDAERRRENEETHINSNNH